MIQLSTRSWRWAVIVAALATLGASFGWNAVSAAEPAASAEGIDIVVPRVRVAIVGTVSAGTPATPAAYATVIAMGTHAQSAGHTSADASGNYRLAGLPNGDYRIAVVPGPQGPTQRGFYQAGASGHFTINHAAATVLHYSGNKLRGKDLTLPIGYTLSGVITRAGNGAGVENVYVSADVPRSEVLSVGPTMTDSTGHYKLTGLSRRPYRLHANAFLTHVNLQSGCYQPTGTAHFAADCSSVPPFSLKGNTTRVNMALPKGLTISGSVVDRASATPLCASVQIVIPGSTDAVSSDVACGSFVVDRLSAGSYQVIVSPQWDNSFVAGAFVTGAYSSENPNRWVPDEGAPTTIDLSDDLNLGEIRPAHGHMVSGHARDAAGRPVADVVVTISGTEGWCCESAITASDGSFAIAGLPNRRYVIRFDPISPSFRQSGWYDMHVPPGFSPWRADATEFTLPSDRPGVNVRLPRGYSISGRITDAAGHAVYAYVGSVGEGAPRWAHGTNADGYYGIGAFAPGRYPVMVSPDSGGAVVFYQKGWYSATAPGHFTPNRRDATLVQVGP